MSGGAYDYLCYKVSGLEGDMEDELLDNFVADFADLLHDLEWWKSGDIGEEDYKEAVTRFKNDWFPKIGVQKETEIRTVQLEDGIELLKIFVRNGYKASIEFIPYEYGVGEKDNRFYNYIIKYEILGG